MKSLFKKALFLTLTAVLLPIVSFADTKQPAGVDFTVKEIKLQNTDNTNYTGQWGIAVSGTVEREKITENTYYGDLQLILKQKNSDNITFLDIFVKSKAGSTFNINTSKTNPEGKEFQVIPWLTSGKQYVLYIAENVDGKALSQEHSIPSNKLKEPIVTPNINIVSVIPKKTGTKKYFEVVFNINKTKKTSDGKLDRINVQVFDVNNKSVGSLGEIAYSKAENAILPHVTTVLANFGEIISGSKYSLSFTDSSGSNVIAPYTIANTDFTSTGSEKGGSSGLTGTGNIYSVSEQKTINDIKSGGLVGSTRCGYGLSDSSNRICGFNDFMWMINNIISYILILILPIAALVFAYAGYLYLTSGESGNKRSAAKKAMTNLVIGVAIILCAWVLVRVVLVSLGVTDEFFIFFAK